MQILSTDNGPHSAEKWAMATARELVPTNLVTDGERLIQALKLQLGVAEALVVHHAAVHTKERAGLAASGGEHLLAPFEPAPHTSPALAAVQAAAEGTPWEAHWALSSVLEAAWGVLESHFSTSAHVERSWHADRNPSDPHCAAFRAQHAPV